MGPAGVRSSKHVEDGEEISYWIEAKTQRLKGRNLEQDQAPPMDGLGVEEEENRHIDHKCKGS